MIDKDFIENMKQLVWDYIRFRGYKKKSFDDFAHWIIHLPDIEDNKKEK